MPQALSAAYAWIGAAIPRGSLPRDRTAGEAKPTSGRIATTHSWTRPRGDAGDHPSASFAIEGTFERESEGAIGGDGRVGSCGTRSRSRPRGVAPRLAASSSGATRSRRHALSRARAQPPPRARPQRLDRTSHGGVSPRAAQGADPSPRGPAPPTDVRRHPTADAANASTGACAVVLPHPAGDAPAGRGAGVSSRRLRPGRDGPHGRRRHPTADAAPADAAADDAADAAAARAAVDVRTRAGTHADDGRT